MGNKLAKASQELSKQSPERRLQLMLDLLTDCNAPTPTTDGNKTKRDTSVSGEALSSSSSGVPSSGQATSRGMFNLNSSNLLTHAANAKRRRIEREGATNIQAANESSEVSSSGATSSTLSGSTSSVARITSTPITPLTDQEIELTRRRRIERERVCPLARAEARMFSTQFTSTAATAPSAPPVDNATDRQTKINEAIAKALSQEKEKEQVKEDEQLCRAMLESELDQLDFQTAADEYICKPCNDDISATQPQVDDDTAPPATAAVEDVNNAGTRRPRRQCKARTEEMMSKNVQSDMQSEREALGHILQDDEKELLDDSDASGNDSSKDDNAEDASSSSEDESDSDEPPPPPASTTRRPKRKEKAPPTPEPSKKKKKSPSTTSTRHRHHKSVASSKPVCSEPRCTRVVKRRGLCYLHAYGPQPKPTKKKSSKKKKPPSTNGNPKCSEPGCTNVVESRGLCRRHAYGTKKCSVDGCTNNASGGNKKCTRHLYPCSFEGCTKQGVCTGSNGRRFCGKHGKTGAPKAYAQSRQRRNRLQNEQYRTNVEYRLRRLACDRLRSALKAMGTSYKGKFKLLGCTAGQLKRYLEQFFREPGNDWMDWKNHGRQEGVRCWEMDHIMPLSSFKNLKDPEQLRRAAHWSNIQPLGAAENNEKKATILDGFEWNGNRWVWSEASGRTNYELPVAGAEEDVTSDEESDEFDESDNE